VTVFCLGPLLFGCASAQLASLPDEPIAVLYRTRDESKRLQDFRDSHAPKPKRPGAIPRARLKELSDYLGVTHIREKLPSDIAGQLAFLDPRSEEVEVQPFAKRGDVPLAWSQDHRRLLFLSDRSGTKSVMEWDRDGQALALRTPDGGTYRGASYGPGRSLALARATAFRGRRKAGSQIVVLEPGKPLRALTLGPQDSRPTWSPMGGPVLFNTRGPDGGLAIGTVDPLGKALPRILTRGRDPQYSRDGAWVYFTARVRRKWRVWRMRPDGSGRELLGHGRLDENLPKVSPDGRDYLYMVTPEEPKNAPPSLRVRALDGSMDRPLVVDGTVLAPVW